MPDVQAAADGRRRGVDRVDVLARLGAVEGVGVVGLPPRAPGGLETLERRLVRYDDGRWSALVVSGAWACWVSVMGEILVCGHRSPETGCCPGRLADCAMTGARRPEYDAGVHRGPAAFLAAAGDHLAVDPVLTTVVSSVAPPGAGDGRRAAAPATPAAGGPRASGERRGRRGRRCGPPRSRRTRSFVLPMPDEAALALARALHARGEEARGFNGALPAARVCAEETARLAGSTRSSRSTRGCTCWARWSRPSRSPVASGGAERRRPGLRWFNAFATTPPSRPRGSGRDARGSSTAEDMAERIAEGRVVLWEVDGEAVHLTGFNLPSFGVCRVGPVYTPREHRGRGYASARSRSCPPGCGTRAPGSASSPTRPTRPRTRSTRRSATGPWPTSVSPGPAWPLPGSCGRLERCVDAE